MRTFYEVEKANFALKFFENLMKSLDLFLESNFYAGVYFIYYKYILDSGLEATYVQNHIFLR